MFALVFGATALVLSVIFREWSQDAGIDEDFASEDMYALLSVLALVAAVIFVVTGVVGL